MASIGLFNGLIDVIYVLEDISVWFEGLLQELALLNPVIAEDVDALADSVEGFEGSLVFLHDEIIEFVFYVFYDAEVLFGEAGDEA